MIPSSSDLNKKWWHRLSKVFFWVLTLCIGFFGVLLAFSSVSTVKEFMLSFENDYSDHHGNEYELKNTTLFFKDEIVARINELNPVMKAQVPDLASLDFTNEELSEIQILKKEILDQAMTARAELEVDNILNQDENGAASNADSFDDYVLNKFSDEPLSNIFKFSVFQSLKISTLKIEDRSIPMIRGLLTANDKEGLKRLIRALEIEDRSERIQEAKQASLLKGPKDLISRNNAAGDIAGLSDFDSIIKYYPIIKIKEWEAYEVNWPWFFPLTMAGPATALFIWLIYNKIFLYVVYGNKNV